MKTVPRLHIITDDAILGDRARIDQIPAFMHPDVAVHLRSRVIGGEHLCEIANWIRGESTKGQIFINDRVDVALAASADGVHLPEAGLPTTTVHALWGNRLTVGRSVHDPNAVAPATAEGADYVIMGPIWDSPSHRARPGLGLAALERATGGRVIAIGGITPDRVEPCIRAGAYGVATISAVWYAPEPASAVDAMRLLLTG